MIKHGNVIDALFNKEVDYLIHCCNCQSTMGSGIAKEIRERVPEAFEAYINSHQKLGRFSQAAGVINLYAQEYYGTYGPFYVANGRQLSYLALMEALKGIRSEFGPDKVYGLPYRFGSDRAGGDWTVVKTIVEQYLPKVHWYVLNKDEYEYLQGTV